MKIICKEINDYIDYADQNPRKINKLRKLLIKNIVKPLLTRENVFFDEKTFYSCIAYCEKWFYPLLPYQKFIYAFFFMYRANNHDIPIFSKFIIMMGRGNGKDGFIAPLANFLQTPLYGVLKYHIDIVANNEEQAQDTYMVVYEMLLDNIKKFKSKFRITAQKIINLKTRSRLRYNTSNAKTKDGKQTGMIIFNEFHAYEDDSQTSVFTSGRGKVKHARTVIITTQGKVREGPLDEELALCEMILNGEENDIRYFPFLCCLDSEEEADNPELWEKANPSIEFFASLKEEIKLAYATMKKKPSDRFEFMTKRMNIPKQDESVALTSWENILATNQTLPELKRKLSICGIDYASLRDFASAGFLFKQRGKWIWIQKTWICANSPFFKDIKFPFDRKGEEGFKDFEVIYENSIPAEKVIEWVIQQMKQYKVQKIIFDDYRWRLVKAEFEKYGLYEETKKNPYGMVRICRNGPITHGLIAPEIELAFLEQRVVYGSSRIMRWYTQNTGIETDKKGNKTFVKIEPKLRKNDGFMALVHAMTGAEELLQEIVYYV